MGWIQTLSQSDLDLPPRQVSSVSKQSDRQEIYTWPHKKPWKIPCLRTKATQPIYENQYVVLPCVSWAQDLLRTLPPPLLRSSWQQLPRRSTQVFPAIRLVGSDACLIRWHNCNHDIHRWLAIIQQAVRTTPVGECRHLWRDPSPHEIWRQRFLSLSAACLSAVITALE